jgi:DNA-binding CsgD family transcriptional regulator
MHLDIEESIQSRTDLAALWRSSREGRLHFPETYCLGGRAFARVELALGRRRPSAVGASLLERVFEGESQKVLAIEEGVSIPTVATHCGNALRAVTHRLSVSHAPIIVVMAALAASGVALGHARLEDVEHDRSWLVSVEVPGATFRDRLSSSEHEVALLSIEGATHEAMARQRGTSQRTVANQLAAVFRKLDISGRGALRAKAIREYASRRPAQPLTVASISSRTAPLPPASRPRAAVVEHWHQAV